MSISLSFIAFLHVSHPTLQPRLNKPSTRDRDRCAPSRRPQSSDLLCLPALHFTRVYPRTSRAPLYISAVDASYCVFPAKLFSSPACRYHFGQSIHIKVSARLVTMRLKMV